MLQESRLEATRRFFTEQKETHTDAHGNNVRLPTNGVFGIQVLPHSNVITEVHIVDSCPSHLVMGRSSLTVEDEETRRPTQKVCSIQTANGIIEGSQTAEAYVQEWNTNVVVTLGDDLPTVFCG